MSYGEVSQTVNFDTDTVALELHTLMEGVVLEHSAPITSVVPGQLVDLYLAVTSPGGYTVPFEDYTAAYTLGASGENDGSVDSQSDLGTRVTATTSPADNDFNASVDVIGWMVVSGEAVPNQTLSATFERPFVESSGFFIDNEAPGLTVIDPGTLGAGTATTLTGTASDNIGILKIQVFEGPVLIGSSFSSEYADAGVAEISFVGNDWSMNWTADEGDYDLTVVAIDASGNQTKFELNANVENATVLNENDSGPGSLRQAVLDASAGEIITFASTVSTVLLTNGEIALDKNLTIDGNVTVDANASSRIFSISSGATVLLNDITMTNGKR